MIEIINFFGNVEDWGENGQKDEVAEWSKALV